MINFKLFALQFMADDNTINWKDHSITIRHSIKLLHITITQYPEQLYTIKKTNDIVYNWNKFLKYWNKHLPEYSKAFNIEFNTLTLDVDYALAPIYISNDNTYIGVYIFNNTIFKHINNNTVMNSIMDNHEKKNKLVSYSFLSSIEPYLLSNKYTTTKTTTKTNTNTNTNTNTKTNTNNTNTTNYTNKYNFMYGILSYNKDDTFINKGFILDTKLNIPISIKYILQNSMNYLPKLEINRIKMSSQNPLNP